MKQILFIMSGLILTLAALAQEHIDVSEVDTKVVPLSASEIRSRLVLSGEIYVVDKNGKLLNQFAESRVWKFNEKGEITSNWSFKAPDLKSVAINQIWKIDGDGKIHVKLEQYEWMKRKKDIREMERGPLVREEKMELKDFSPINWVAHSNEKERVIVRFTPKLGNKVEQIEASDLPISLENATVYDSKGNVWANIDGLEGKYVGFKTHKGLIKMSFVAFKGASHIGFAQGPIIELKTDDGLKISVKNQSTFFPAGRSAKIYGIVDVSKKSDRLNAVHSSSSSTESSFLERSGQ